MLGTILIGLLVMALFGALPRWPHSRSWGYYPTAGLGIILLIVIVLLFSVEFDKLTFPRDAAALIAWGVCSREHSGIPFLAFSSPGFAPDEHRSSRQ
jgi:hypothetical protein